VIGVPVRTEPLHAVEAVQYELLHDLGGKAEPDADVALLDDENGYVEAHEPTQGFPGGREPLAIARIGEPLDGGEQAGRQRRHLDLQRDRQEDSRHDAPEAQRKLPPIAPDEGEDVEDGDAPHGGGFSRKEWGP